MYTEEDHKKLFKRFFGNELKIWNSIKDAATQLKIHKGTISNVLSGVKGKLTAGGFRWKYVD